MSDVERSLWPEPRRVVRGAGAIALPRDFTIAVAPDRETIDVARTALARFRTLGFDPRVTAGSAASAHVRVERRAGFEPEAYSLRVDARAIEIAASDRAGAWNALQTLAQILSACDRDGAASQRTVIDVPSLTIDDAPDFAIRGALLDVSRTRVPRLETLFGLVDELAALKTNQLELYCEHVFAYPGHETVWRDSSPLSGADLLALDAYCSARCIELVPNQQSFGHLHRWLVHEPYRHLAEVPDGVEHAFSRSKEPYGLCATDPRALTFLSALYDELLPHFSSASFAVGLDETFDLGLGRSRELCERVGKGRVYVDFLRAVHALVAARGRRMRFWGDVVLQHPAHIADVPRDALALAWGYEAGHPFDAEVRRFAESGLDFLVCPGTSSWQSFAGRTSNLIANARAAVDAAREHGARGVMVTDWGDRGHLQPYPVKLAGLAAVAGLAWNASSELDEARLADVLDAHVYRDRARLLGRASLALGRANEVSRASSTNGSPLFFTVAFAEKEFPHPRVTGLTHEGLDDAAAHARAERAKLARAQPIRADARALVDEWTLCADAVDFACELGRERLRAPRGAPLSALAEREPLAERLASLSRDHRRLWLARDRPGGLDESASWLERPLALLRGEPLAQL